MSEKNEKFFEELKKAIVQKVKKNKKFLELLEERIDNMNNLLVGKKGRCFLRDGNKSHNIGSFVKGEMGFNTNLFFYFADEIVFIFPPLRIFALIEDQNKLVFKKSCKKVYVGDRSLIDLLFHGTPWFNSATNQED